MKEEIDAMAKVRKHKMFKYYSFLAAIKFRIERILYILFGYDPYK